jgi:hypothetical protein
MVELEVESVRVFVTDGCESLLVVDELFEFRISSCPVETGELDTVMF